MSVTEAIELQANSVMATAKQISRRDFVRYAALVGMAVPAAYAMAGKISGERKS